MNPTPNEIRLLTMIYTLPRPVPAAVLASNLKVSSQWISEYGGQLEAKAYCVRERRGTSVWWDLTARGRAFMEARTCSE